MNTDAIDKKIEYIQKSTRTTFAFMVPLHNKLRMKWSWYYRYHARPFSNALNFTFLALTVLSAACLVVFNLPNYTQASSGIGVWTPTSLTNAPDARLNHTAVWTGSKMIVWGGQSSSGTLYNSGGIYDPATDSWATISQVNAPTARDNHSAIWTGSKMIIWGGNGELYSSAFNSGGIYDPATDSWATISQVNAPTARAVHSAVWTGSKMIVWGGFDGCETNIGGIYDPETDSWTRTSSDNAPEVRFYHAAVWTGSKMIIWGGNGWSNTPIGTGGIYDPVTDSWTSVSMANAPEVRFYHAAVWTGSKMIIWGGNGVSYTPVGSGGIYDPATDSWAPCPVDSAPASRYEHSAVWTGNKMIVWGGYISGAFTNSGGVYDPGRISLRVSTDFPNTVSISGNASTYEPGATATITAIPSNPYYSFDHWSVDCNGSDNPLSLSMDANKSCAAVFTYHGPQNTIAASAVPVGAGSVIQDNDSYKVGDQATLTATPNTSYLFDHWSGDCNGSDNPIILNTDANKSCTAVFVKSASLVVTSDPPGIGIISGSKSPYSVGAIANLAAISNSPNYFFDHWAGDCSGSDNLLSLTMDADKTCSAVFIPDPSIPTVEISSWTNLDNVRNGLSAKYLLIKDLSTADPDYQTIGANFQPIGRDSDSFSGIFDGGNHTIEGLTIAADYDYIGLFAQTSSAALISNLILADVDIDASNSSYVGSLAGYSNGPIANCHVNGTINAPNSEFVGGLVGDLENIISGSSVDADITNSDWDVAGLAGAASYDTARALIVDSYSTGDITAAGDVGGLVGEATLNLSINDSYATGSINGSDGFAGGLIGYRGGGSSVLTITGSHYNGQITVREYAGGLIGLTNDYSNSQTTITNSYASGSVTETDWGFAGGLVGCGSDRSEDVLTITDSHYVGDVTGSYYVGGIVGSANYGPNDKTTITDSYASGSVTAASDGYAGGLVGSGSESDGTVLTINGSHYNGDVAASGSNGWEVGGLVGQSNGNISDQTTISNSYSTGTVKGIEAVGGLLGEHDRGHLTIEKSYSASAVSKNESDADFYYIGGLVGYTDVEDVHITDSYATGDVTGDPNTSQEIGGLVGYSNGQIHINNSFSTGDIAGSDYVGGLLGGINDTSQITNSFATGRISSESGSNLGGLVGMSGSDISNSFWYRQGGPAQSCYPDGDEGCTTKTDLNWFKGNHINEPMLSWDFADTWAAKANDFPELKWQVVPVAAPPTDTTQPATEPQSEPTAQATASPASANAVVPATTAAPATPVLTNPLQGKSSAELTEIRNQVIAQLSLDTSSVKVTRKDNTIQIISSVIALGFDITQLVPDSEQLDPNLAKEYISYSNRPKFAGFTLPGYKVKIIIHSDPIEAVVTADSTGYFEYTPTTDLEPGDHTIAIATAAPGQDAYTALSAETKFAIASEPAEPATANATDKAAAKNTDTDKKTNSLLSIFMYLGALILVASSLYFLKRKLRK